ncbi:MAG: hypothetical protein DLM60_14315 [Pseudonocardiales bacterium]|nr:hypothetical protein [Actinomycetota bacterium]PZS17083.1 MAG: hypothetical protein DLM60_14315 [Pseudonocardiales bacterium]
MVSGDRGAVRTVAQASATLYVLLLEHPLDRRGRCPSCRPPAAVFGRRRRPCRIHLLTGFYLLYPGDFLLSYLAAELGLGPLALSGEPETTEVLPRAAAGSGNSCRRNAPASMGGASDAH